MNATHATLRIASLAAGGDGVGRLDGLAVFVPRTAPGDLVDVTVHPHGRFARGELRGVLEHGPERVQPPCVHYTRDRCGGCQLQHVSLEAQLQAKTAIVRDALQRIGDVPVEVPSVRPSPAPWRYRNSLTLALRRQGRSPDAEWHFGLRDFADPERVFDLDDCLITDERVLAVWHEIRAAAGQLPNATRLRGTARWLGTAASLSLVGGGSWPAARRAAFERACPSVATAQWTPHQQPPRVLWDRRAEPRPPAASFTQVNAGMAAALRSDVLQRALAYEPRTVVDAYAGAGDVATALQAHGVQVTAIEVDAAAAAWSASRLVPPSRSVAGRVEDCLARALPADVVLLNPPRAGLDERVTRLLARAVPAPRAVLYVSCNPATLARDVRRLDGFRVVHAQPYDMFPQTAHVETLCELTPLRAA